MEIIDPTQYPSWEKLLLSTPGGTFFHTSSWAKVLKEAYEYSPKYFTEIDGGQISTLIPIMEVRSFLTGCRGVSLPFTDYCEPIANGNNQFEDLLNHVIEYGKKYGWKSLELRSGNKLLPSTVSSVTYIGHVLNLSQSEEQVYANFRDSTKRNIKKALKEGVKAKIYDSLESIKEFYRLNSITRKQHGLPPQPFNFFEKVHDHIISKNLGFVILASIHQENIAGAIFFHFGEKAIYKYGASQLRYQHLRANNLVMWEGIRECTRRGCTILSLGRTDLGHEGLLQFKRGWGTTEQQINYYRYDFKDESFISGRSRTTGFHNTIFRNMPVPILNKVGALLYRHFA
jgi:hypothetical protein